ncbi:DinB family protein [Muriicola sp.]|uniref:DinB family protein n=1 Tax=Muriicola sp. TaxID=2020856 RepID=UPI003569BC2C
MKTLKTFSILSMALMLWISAPAQEAAPAEAPMSSADLGFNFARSMAIRAAEQMPEEYYDFRPTEEVRTFGEILAHLADSNFRMWSIATGEDNPMPEVPATKKEVIEALKKSYEVLADARNTLTEEEMDRMVGFFGSSHAARTVLDFSAFHGIEHYGNLIVYMRMKGLVPPSSQQ